MKNHRYTLEIALVKSNKTHPDEQAWRGSITDETTHIKTVIAEYAVPLSWGHLLHRSIFFSEYFIYNEAKYHGAHPAKRPPMPYAKVIVEAPKSYANGKLYKSVISGFTPQKKNKEKMVKLSDTKASVETGMATKEKADSSATSPANSPLTKPRPIEMPTPFANSK